MEEFCGVMEANVVRENLNTYTQRKLFEILLNQPEIRLYLPYSD